MPNAIKRFHMLMKDKIRMVTGASEKIRVRRYNNSITTIPSFNQILPIIFKILGNFCIFAYCHNFKRFQSDQIETHNAKLSGGLTRPSGGGPQARNVLERLVKTRLAECMQTWQSRATTKQCEA